jgi:signal transduction histidine kinase
MPARGRMKISVFRNLNIGPGLTLTFAALIALILGGNGLVIWQFYSAQTQADRLTGLSQQLIAVLRFQQSLLTFHRQLADMANSRSSALPSSDAELLRRNLVQQTAQTRAVLARLPSGTPVDPEFVPTLEAVEASQLQAIISLATANDWDAVRLRLANELTPLETQTSVLVDSIDHELTEQLTPAVSNMRTAQRRILIIVPVTALFTFLVAAFFGWNMTRRILQLRLEERVNERTRIAGDLHDTLLQGLISVSMQLHVAVERLGTESPARLSFERILQLMSQVIEEGRNAIRGFRTVEKDTRDLADALSTIPRELDVHEEIAFRVIVEGHARSLHPLIRDDIYLIGREALVNAFRHARASEVEVEIEYSAHQLRVLVRDNGCGIDTEMLRCGRDGHWGLSGMDERAERMGAKLKVLSRPREGTEVELCIPARVAFKSARSQRVSSRASV